MSKASLVISFLAILLVVGLFVRVGQVQGDLEQKISSLSRSSAAIMHEPEEHEIEVAEHMTRIQAFNTKLWAAGNSDNQELVEFYVHELEEAMELIADARVEDEGINVSQAMQQIGIPALETFEKTMETHGLGAFNQHYQNLVQACNACHQACQYPFIKVQVPTTIRFDEQDFTP